MHGMHNMTLQGQGLCKDTDTRRDRRDVTNLQSVGCQTSACALATLLLLSIGIKLSGPVTLATLEQVLNGCAAAIASIWVVCSRILLRTPARTDSISK